uniref:Midasin n=1 Tax=Schistosoma mansoni TaxID=6183 RepID=A0A5K4FCW8_SCHMA
MVKRNKRKSKVLGPCAEEPTVKSPEDICITTHECKKNPLVLFSRLIEVEAAAKQSLERYEPILIAGPVGCGKSSLANKLAKEYCNVIRTIQISEHTDAKTLLGAYCCTEIPGQFTWRPGPLISSIEQGHGLVLEDIDRGSSELQLLITSVLRKLRSYSVNSKNILLDPVSGNPITHHPNFRLLMTRRFISCHGEDFRQESGNILVEFLDRYCFVITLPNFSKDETNLLISHQYPTLVPFIDRIMNIYTFVVDSFRNANIVIQSTMNSSRLRGISVRDLLKFCSRISTLTEKENFSELLLLNAVDCFLSSMCNSIKQLEIACRLAGELNLSVENARNILCCRSVEISLQPQNSVLKVGRTILPCRRTPEWEIKVSGGNSILQSSNDIIWPFASTRLSSSLLERLAVAVQHKEPVLLVGETGTGKTSTVQRLAYLTGHRLRVINLNQQSDSVDLMGGFKPVDFQVFVRPLREKFESLFTCTFKLDNNLVFLGHINTCFQSGRWLDLITLMRHPARVAVQRDSSVDTSEWIKFLNDLTILEKRLENITKSNKPGLGFAFIEGALVRSVQDGDWILLDEINLAPAEMLDSLSGLLDSEYGSLILTERGDNEPIKRHPDFHLFAAMNPATDVGKRELPVGLRNRFTEFYIPELDPCINVNKSEASMDLDSSRHIEVIRSNNCEDLATLARSYLVALNPTPSQLSTIVRLYSALRQAAVEGLVDGVGQRPHFSLRTLCRALIEAGRGYHGSILRSLYEGLLFSFGSQICRTSRPILDTLIQRYLCSGWNKDSSSLLRLLNTPLPIPQLNNQYSDDYFVNVEGYWLPKGSQQPISIDNKNELPGNYILTPSVQANLKDLARVVAAGGGLPVLLQGETSVGKTSLITYLAKRVGQVCYRINNHEHTDQQTYLGTYTVSSTAYTTQSNTDNHNNQGNDNEALKKTSTSLVFKDGLLVKAMRNGYWIILDELNLAPTEILEALNRVLDDNRSVFITETQETIKAHPHFRLFATQNPPGLYAGRKMLSRALRNRFIELHFDTIPRNELEIILEKKCLLPSSRAQRLVEVMHRLQLARCTSNLFQGKDSFITLRDLFRWAERYRLATCDKLVTGQIDNKKNEQTIFFDWDGYLADQGYLLLAGRVRNPTEIHIVTDVIESVFKRKVTESRLFDLNESTSPVVYEFLQPVLSKETVCYTGFDHIVWTKDMRRLLVLVGNALKYEEPVLLVGETGCGKTTICQLIAALHNQRLHCLNCHQCTEASDFLGELRPVRHSSEVNEKESKNDCRLFEWINGPLVTAMVNGDLFLLDEISLADDAVLERLNSLLEPERQLHLAECSEDSLMVNNNDNNNNSNSITTPYTQLLTAHSKFRFIATMNPGGDYGKKELSPALRNRFTEIWCPSPIFTSNHIQSTISSLSYNESDQLSNSLLDCQHIVMHNLQLKVPMYFKMGNDDFVKQFSEKMINFIHWYAVTQNEYKSNGTGSLCQRPSPTIRDLIVWIDFIQTAVTTQNVINSSNRLNLFSACIHGACLVFLDVIDHVLPNRNVNEQIDDNNFQSTAVHFLIDQLYSMDKDILFKQIQLSIPNSSDEMYASFASELNEKFVSTKNNELFGCEPFFISTGPFIDSLTNTNFIFDAPTPSSNLKRLLRAMQLPSRALLLEGSPGVGKTTLVLALAKASGHKVIRINLSEATEVSDLFGCDLPVEGAEAGVFAWKSGPFLQGLCEGHWIILDEMNLASQSVLESLNACLDHRGEVFIPELNNTFKINSYATRLFACQNPLREGGGRKGLPRSFLNRFTQVYMKPLSKSDQEFILIQLYPDIPKNYIHLMVTFNDMVNEQINIKHEFGNQGGPWEFNLRDLTRWCDLIIKGKDFEGFNPGLYVHLLYTNRMRTAQDKQKMVDLWTVVCNTILNMPEMFYYEPYGDIRLFNESSLQCGLAHFTCYSINYSICNEFEYLIIMDHHRSILESFLKVIEMGWMVMLNGSPGCGKRTLAHIASILLGQTLVTMCLSPTSDTIELLGSLEQRESGGLFEWIDSPLVKGIINGYWVLIENAQLCSPSVLDRLNSLLEPNGELLLSERGLDANGKLVTLKAHPNFRLILTVDEFVGVGANCSTGISRAMRNRGLEITFTEPIMQPHVDLLRLFTAINVPKPIAIGLVEFQGLFLEVCENQTSFLEFYSKCFNGKAQLLDNNTTTHQSINCHHLKRIPIGALISASHYAKQLLIGSSSDPSVSIKGLQVPKIETKKRKMQKMVTKKHDDINKLNNTDDDITTDEILIHILNYTYCHRQMNTKSIEFVKYLINYYVKHIRHTDPLHTELHSMYHLPVNYLHHTVNEIIQNRLPIIYRKSYTNLIQITLKEYYDKPLNIDIQLMIQRILLEQANFTDIQSELFDLKAFQFNESNMTMIKLSEWSNWPDLRWIPGWKHLIYSLENESDDLIYEWNKKLYLLLINELIQSTHHCIHQQFNDNQSYSLLQSSDLHRIPVLKIIKLSMENNIPSIWLDNYPGLSNLKEQWFTFLTNLSNHFLNYKDILTKSDDLLSNLYMKWISKAWIWLRLFGSRPLGDSFDWPERLLFHNQHIVFNNLTEDQSLPNLTIISQYFQSKLAPLNVPKCQLQLNALSVDWLQFGQLMNEFLIRFKTELNITGSNNNDDGDNDDEEGEEEEMSNHGDGDVAMVHHNDDNPNDMMDFYCLWPWTMILLSKFVDIKLLGNTLQQQYDVNNNQWDLTESLRIYFRSNLLTLNRPKLLAYLSMATKCLYKINNCEQMRVMKQLLQELNFTIMNTNNSNSSIFLTFALKKLDWSLPNQLLNVHSVNQPDILGEWRSISHALIHITWPMLCEYGTCSFTGKLTVYGWRYRQQAIQKANHLLYLSPKQETTNMSKNEYLQCNNLEMIIQHAFNILYGIYQVVHSIQKVINSQNNDTNEEDTLSPIISINNLIELINWTRNVFNPSINLLKSYISNDKSNDWHRIIRLIELLIRYLEQLSSSLSNQKSNNNDVHHDDNDDSDDILNYKFILSNCWLLIGFLYLRCNCPYSPLDPYIVVQVEEEAVKHEINYIRNELQFRENMQKLASGAYNNSLLPSLINANPLNINGHVNCGLLHPWLGVLVNRLHYLKQKAETLKQQLGFSCENVLVTRQNSNFEYVEIRRRITSYITDFTEEFLLVHCLLDTNNNNNNIKRIEKTIELQKLRCWIETTSMLGDWLTEPNRLNTFADIITPFLYGLFYIYRGLRVMFHETIAQNNSLNVTVSSMITNLVTSLLPNTQNDNVILPVISGGQRLSRSLSLALELANSKSRRLIQQLFNSINNPTSFTGNVIGVSHRIHETQFRISSFILNLLWLHNAEKHSSSNVTDIHNKLIGRILNSIILPLNQHWKQIELERKQLAESRASLFLEADHRKQLIRNDLQGIKSKKMKHHERSTSPDLIDQSLNEEVDWRLRFSEIGCINAYTELGIHHNSQVGNFEKEKEIQQTVAKLEAIDKWLKNSLNGSGKYWIPEEKELVYFIKRLVYLLLLNSNCTINYPLNSSLLIDKHSTTQSVDISSIFSWHWHTVLYGFNLASWLSIESKFSLDPTIDEQTTLSYIGITAYMGQYDIRANPILPIHHLSKFSNTSFNHYCNTKSHCYNIYLDPIPLEEAEKLNVLMRNLEKQIKHILTQWPGQPSLLRLLVIIHRIESFTVSDPLIKFVTGVEMLWQVMQEWERDAAKHVSLNESSKEVCNLLVSWRKMELSYWLATLDSAEIQISNRCVTLWFHLYDLFLRPGSYSRQLKSLYSKYQSKMSNSSCLKDNTGADDNDDHGRKRLQLETDRFDALVELFEKGPIGEFSSRWKLVASIYSALNLWPGLSETERSSSKRIVGNAVWFYAQFLPCVTEELSNLRHPIEKELKGLVNVTKWGHYSRFWSVKTNVDRCKKSIHKHVKKWESILQQPVRPIFENAVKIPTYLKSNNGNNNNDHICSSSLLKLEMTDLLAILKHCSFKKSFNNLQQLYGHFNEQEDQEQSKFNFTLHLKRLPSIIKCLHKHVYTMVHNSPIIQWTKHLRSGLQMWIDFVHELSRQTDRLNSTCPTGNQLAKFNKHKLNKTKCKSISSKRNHPSNNEEDEEEDEELNKTRQWYQEFTALQQRKRLALSDWLKVATFKHSSTVINQSLDISDPTTKLTESIDSTELINDGNEVEILSDNNDDDHLFEELNLPNLGLSYRRGQRQTQTGHMSRFLVQLHGDPWSYVNQFIGRNLDVINTDSEDYFIHCVCNRLSRLISLRASLPSVPGPGDGDVDTSVAILSEIGGPNNLSRLIGIMSDLLNQCSSEFKVCCEFTGISKKISRLVMEYANSLNVSMITSNDKQPVDDGNEQIIQYCTCYPLDLDKLKRIRISTQNLDQIIREHLYQWNVFWIVFQKQTINEPFNISKLSCLFGSEGWTWLTNNPELLSTYTLENSKQLVEITESYMESLKLAFINVLTCTTHLLGLNTFLWNNAVHEAYEKLSSSMKHLQEILNSLLNAYKTCNRVVLFASVFESVQQQINVEWNKIHCELSIISYDGIHNDSDLTNFHTTNLTTDNNLSSINSITYKSDMKFEQLTNRLVHSMLKAIEILYDSDQINDNTDNKSDQLSLLHHYSTMISKVLTSTLPQINKYLINIRSMLQERQSTLLKNEYEMVFQSRLIIIQCIYPLMDGLSKALCIRCIQFWHLLDIWFKLGEFAMQITGRIITEGFCRPANLARDNQLTGDENSSSSSSSKADNEQSVDRGGESGGTSLTSNTNDAVNAKDITNELECQEQIEGLLNDRKQQRDDNDLNKNRNEEDNNTNGIEMPDDDFDGQYDDPDLENCDLDNDDSEQLEQENFDDKMDETDGHNNDDLAKEMWASDDEETDKDDNNKPKRDSDGNKENDKTGGVEDDKPRNNRNKKADHDSGNIQEQKSKQHPESTEDDDGDNDEDHSDKLDELENKSPKRKKPKHANETPGNRTTVANEDIMQDEMDNESDQPTDNKSESTQTKPSDDHETSDVDERDQGLPVDIDADQMNNEEDMTERDVEDLPGDLFDNQMDFDADNDGEEIDDPSSGQLDGEKDNEEESAINENEINENNKIETMDTDEQNTEIPENVEVFPYHGAGTSDLDDNNNKSNAFGGDEHNPQEDDKTETNNVDHDDTDVNSSNQTSTQHSNQGNVSGEKYTTSTSQSDTSGANAEQQQQCQQDVKRNQTHSGPKPTSDNRSLSNKQNALSKAETIEIDLEHCSEKQQSPLPNQNSELFQHLPNSEDLNAHNEDDYPCVRDSATLDQAEQQLLGNSDPMKKSNDNDREEKDIGLENDNDNNIDDDGKLPISELEKTDASTNVLPQQNKHVKPLMKGNQVPGGHETVESDPTKEFVPTLSAQRPPESISCTRAEVLLQSTNVNLSTEIPTNLQIIENKFSETSIENCLDWSLYCQRSNSLARQLCETLRLVLEPTKASRLRGDYRTGKRINMRKIIPYLASQFRKDKIWLRRSQPSQREYRILIAVDDSSSMSENLCKQMTFESLTTVITALNLLEVGRIGVCSFGESVRVLHDLKDPWVTDAGPRVLSQFTFGQPKTSLVQLLQCTIQLMNSTSYMNSTNTNAIPSQLLLILSDGVFSEDPQSPSLQAAVRLARDSHIFPVCLILDDVRKKHSIFDLRRYCGPGKLQPYMDVFPLPYYLVLRDLACLPNLLADALRQWFELESSIGR